MNYTQSIGNYVELQCLAKFTEMGYECSIPFGAEAKYDFIVDTGKELLRIQCKSSHQTKKHNGELDNAFTFSTVVTTTNTKKTVRHKYDNTQIDYFATYYDGKVYVIPVDECSTAKTLRFSPPLNNNQNYNKAEDYEIEKRFSTNEELERTKIEFLNRMINHSKEKKVNLCVKCGKETAGYSERGYCPQCSSIESRAVERPSREELKDMIRNNSFLSIGEKYGVSDNAIRKWCRAENLPYKKSEIKQYSDLEWETI